MNVLIIEDEPLAADRLCALLQEVDPAAIIAGRCNSVATSRAWLHAHHPDLILADIQLLDGVSFAIFEEDTVSTPVIFTTAYDQYAIRAFKINSVDYLLKPIRKEDLARAIEKHRRTQATRLIDMQALREGMLSPLPTYKKRFFVQFADRLRIIEAADVAYFYALEGSVFLMGKDRETLPLDLTLEELEEVLDPSAFFRINRKMIIAFRAIVHMVAYSRSRVKITLTPPEPKSVEALVSVERSAAFKKWLDQ